MSPAEIVLRAIGALAWLAVAGWLVPSVIGALGRHARANDRWRSVLAFAALLFVLYHLRWLLGIDIGLVLHVISLLLAGFALLVVVAHGRGERS